MQIDHYTPAIVGERLIQAGRTLMALQVPGCRPAWYRSGMPAILPQALAQEFGIDYLLHARVDVRIDAPPSAEIDRMDEAMAWIRDHLSGDTTAIIRHRRVMLMRCLVRPDNDDRHVFSYRAIGARFGMSHTHIKVLWGDGLGCISSGLNRKGATVRVAPAKFRPGSIGDICRLAIEGVARDLTVA